MKNYKKLWEMLWEWLEGPENQDTFLSWDEIQGKMSELEGSEEPPK